MKKFLFIFSLCAFFVSSLAIATCSDDGENGSCSSNSHKRNFVYEVRENAISPDTTTDVPSTAIGEKAYMAIYSFNHKKFLKATKWVAQHSWIGMGKEKLRVCQKAKAVLLMKAIAKKQYQCFALEACNLTVCTKLSKI